LRVSNAYGERQVSKSSQGIIPALIDGELRQKRFTIWGDGSVIRDYIHVSDIVSAFLRASEHNEEPRIFNIGSGIGQSVNDIIHTLESHLGKKLDIVYEPGRPYDVPINILDVSLAKQTLGWEPKKMLFDGIGQTLAYMRSH
jgi:UDP-glucose 4-epimerase